MQNWWCAPLKGNNNIELLPLTCLNTSLVSCLTLELLFPSLFPVAQGPVAMAPSGVFMLCMTMSVMSVAWS